VITLRVAIESAKRAAVEFVKANPEDPKNWYPCGFAWLTYKCRKNAKEAADLIAHGFRWSDYEKRYILSPYEWTNTQAMDYKESILRAMQAELKVHGYEFGIHTRID
jgi:hypothetical protein